FRREREQPWESLLVGKPGSALPRVDVPEPDFAERPRDAGCDATCNQEVARGGIRHRRNSPRIAFECSAFSAWSFKELHPPSEEVDGRDELAVGGDHHRADRLCRLDAESLTPFGQVPDSQTAVRSPRCECYPIRAEGE